MGLEEDVLNHAGVLQVWETVRGDSLPAVAINNMLKYAADVTGQEKLDAAAFRKLVAHFA